MLCSSFAEAKCLDRKMVLILFSLKVWQTNYLECSHTYRPAHADVVLSVAIHPEQNDTVVSCSDDGRIIVWDLRMPKPALGTVPFEWLSTTIELCRI